MPDRLPPKRPSLRFRRLAVLALGLSVPAVAFAGQVKGKLLGLEVENMYGLMNSYRDQLHRTSRSVTKPGVKVITISAGDLFLKANYQDFRRLAEVDLAIAADGEVTLPALIEAVKRLATGDRQRLFQGVLVHLVDDVVGGSSRDGVVRRVQLALTTRVRDLLDKNDDVHRQTNLRRGLLGAGSAARLAPIMDVTGW